MEAEDISTKYAKALFAMITPEKLHEGLKHIHVMDQLMSDKILSFFKNPIIVLENKKKVLKDIFSSSFQKKSTLVETLFHFLYLLLEKQRFGLIKEIFQKFRLLAHESMGVLEGQLITPAPVAAAMRKKLEKKLELKFGKKVLLQESIDPSLVGGAVILVENHLIDFSIKGKLARLKKYLLSKE